MNPLLAVIGFFGGSAALGGYAYGKHLEKEYPAQGTNYEIGKEYELEDGQKKIFIGCAGHSTETLEEGLDPERGVYIADKKKAQLYAKINGGSDGGSIIHIFAKEHPKPTDCLMQDYEGSYAPLSGPGFRRINAEFREREKVDIDTLVGISGAFQRMLRDKNKDN